MLTMSYDHICDWLIEFMEQRLSKIRTCASLPFQNSISKHISPYCAFRNVKHKIMTFSQKLSPVRVLHKDGKLQVSRHSGHFSEISDCNCGEYLQYTERKLHYSSTVKSRSPLSPVWRLEHQRLCRWIRRLASSALRVLKDQGGGGEKKGSKSLQRVRHGINQLEWYVL